MNIDAILQEPTISRRRQKLGAMTDGLGLGDAYDATLGRIKGQGGEKARLGMAALMWISHSERPLKVDELCHALAVRIGAPDLDGDNVPSVGTLLTCCQGLVTIDKEVSTIRLIHFTVQEYLRAHPELFSSAHSTIAEACLSCLNSQQVKALSASPSSDLEDSELEDSYLQSMPFLEYSSLYWGIHAKRELSDCARLLALKLFDDYNNHISIEILLKEQEWKYNNLYFSKPYLFSGLHCTSFFGIVEMVACLVETEGYNISKKDSGGNTPLMWAARNGHEEVVKILLGRDDFNPDGLDSGADRLLWCAAQGGCAAEGGHEGVMKILLERGDVNPDKPTKFGETLLGYAAYDGCEWMVELLLGRDDIDPDKPDSGGDTPLWYAAGRGHYGVVKILLERGGVNPDKLDKLGQTLLCDAAEDGCERMVEMLLGRDDVNPNKPNMLGKTPLCCAAERGQEGVVKILLRRGDVNFDKPDNLGRTPLWCAAWNGHEGVAKILLGVDDVNPDQQDMFDETPLYCAAENGHEGIVKMLLE